MNDNEIKDLIKNDSEELEIPDSLSPENIEKKLSKKKGPRITHIRRYMTVAAAAFVCLLIPFALSTMEKPGAATALSEKNASSSELAASPQVSVTEAFKGAFYTAKSQDELKEQIADSNRKRAESKTYNGDEDVFVLEDAAAAPAAKQAAGAQNSAAESSRTTGAAAEELHSETNTREKGVDEGDIIKTDGKYIYVVKKNSDQVDIVDISGEKMKVVSKINVRSHLDNSGRITAKELYFSGDMLIILSDYTEISFSENDDNAINWNANNGSTSALIFDIKDRSDPKLTGNITQSGHYMSSRLRDGYLYTFSSDYGMDIPYVCNSIVDYRDVYLGKNDDFYNAAYTITSVNINDPSKTADTKCIYSNIQDVYVSNGSIYLERSSYSDSAGAGTDIFKLSYKDGKIAPVATTSVRGNINDSFSIDEGSDETLRIAVTYYGNGGNNWSQSNALYIYDKDLKILSSLEDIAPGESIKSARYIGNMLYFVTFKNTDPVFSIDLSDPKAPKILGELKIPGFSEYLHPWGEGRLLGIGYMADENYEWAKITGMKLSMFNLADPGNVKEEDVSNYPGNYNIPALYEYKRILVDERLNLIGFAIEKNVLNKKGIYQKTEYKYAVFSYENNNFKLNYMFDISDPYYTAAVFSGKNLYIYDRNQLKRFDLSGGNVNVSKPDETVDM